MTSGASEQTTCIVGHAGTCGTVLLFYRYPCPSRFLARSSFMLQSKFRRILSSPVLSGLAVLSSPVLPFTTRGAVALIPHST